MDILEVQLPCSLNEAPGYASARWFNFCPRRSRLKTHAERSDDQAIEDATDAGCRNPAVESGVASCVDRGLPTRLDTRQSFLRQLSHATQSQTVADILAHFTHLVQPLLEARQTIILGPRMSVSNYICDNECPRAPHHPTL